MSEELKFTVEQIKDIPREVVALSSMFYTEGFEIYAAGGCVRDLYLNRTPHDWDLCTSAKPEQTMAILKKFGVSFTTIGIEFGENPSQCVFHNLHSQNHHCGNDDINQRHGHSEDGSYVKPQLQRTKSNQIYRHVLDEKECVLI